MDNRKLNLLALKQAAGLATASEVATLGDAYRVIGGGLAVLFAPMDADTWQRRYAGRTHDLYVRDFAGAEPPADVPATPAVTRTADGLILCAPDREPPHPGKPHAHRPHGIGRG